jgi:hypothetical protein
MFKLTKPCDSCPFRKVDGIRLTPERAREIAGLFTDSQGGTFPCHKTVDYDIEDDTDDARQMRAPEQLCAGGLIFAEKQGSVNQLMRIMERVGGYDPSALRGHDEVFDSLSEMLRAQRPRRLRWRRTS